MKKLLLVLFILPLFANAQIYPGPAIDSTTFVFSSGDSLTHHTYNGGYYFGGGSDTAIIAVDTSSATLWQIGNTIKPVFSNDSIVAHGIMTDTVNTYPANANDFFILKVSYLPNFVVEFWHKYQTDSTHAGGIVEFSTDFGATWLNVASCPSIEAGNFYTAADTLISGQPAFMGNSSGEQLSSITIINCVAFKTTTTPCLPLYDGYNILYFRFRFVSDSTIDSLSGWMIDSIRVIGSMCEGAVPEVTAQNIISIFPNPAYNDLTVTGTNLINQISITNLLGQVVYTGQYNAKEVHIDVAELPSGIYFVKVNGSEVRKFIKE